MYIFFFKFFSIIGYYKIVNTVSRAIYRSHCLPTLYIVYYLLISGSQFIPLLLSSTFVNLKFVSVCEFDSVL